MPIPTPQAASFDLFPTLTRAQIDAARTSAWHYTFEDLTFPAMVIDLSSSGEEEAFIHWLESDSIFLPEGSEGANPPPASISPIEESAASSSRPRASSTASNASSSSSSSEAPVYRLPNLNAAIRDALHKYGGAVFPKLNWTSPKDAAFILPQTSSGPLHCQSPSDVYLLLKSSDFISHDLDTERAYGEEEGSAGGRPKIELVLKKYEDINPAREVRCFVRNNALIGVTQRDLNFYDHLQSEETRTQICDTVRELWEDEIRENYEGGPDYIFDLYLSPKMTSAKIIDFQPYRPSTDPLLFTYDELLDITETAFEPPSDSEVTRPRLPIFKIIESRAHPDANRNAPAYQANMMPLEMIEMGEGRNMAEFKEAWDEAVAAGMAG
ncbi:hypothetical protein CI109_103241 [Kwoniella shandongensis]|uniref:Cell division cycle protein 123 n=1 Tax=Kwoniella shandongensis TaxID=1734106 RepID=A0AAJ8LKB3_9TREE